MIFVFIIVITTISSITNSQSTCNYVYNHESDTVWATDVCMQTSTTSNYYSKFQCPSPDSSNIVPNVTIYLNDNCTIQASTFSMDDPRTGNISFSYNCDATHSGCYVEYKENCDETFNSLLNNSLTPNNIYSPIDTCINDESETYSFKFECDDGGMTYTQYTSLDCDDKKLIYTKNVYGCTLLDSQDSQFLDDTYWQFQSCDLSPTISPSNIPSSSPISSPTYQPSSMPTKYPTYLIPFFNKSLDEIIDLLEGNTTITDSTGSSANSIIDHKIIFQIGLYLLVVIVTIINFEI